MMHAERFASKGNRGIQQPSAPQREFPVKRIQGLQTKAAFL